MKRFVNVSPCVRRQFLIFLSLAAASLGIATAGEIETKTASIPAPQQLPEPADRARVMILDEQMLMQRQQELAQRQQQLEEHHRALPERKPARAIQKLPAEPESISPTSLNALQSPIKISFNRVLTMQETAAEVSTVCEPSIAARGDEVLITGNWFASFSTNARSPISKFEAIEPDKLFPPKSGIHFCCDQVAIYDPKRDAMFWLLQYSNKNESDNIVPNFLRLAVATKEDIKNQRWRYYDLSPQGVGKYTDEWFDFPACALGSKFLYFTINTYPTTEEGGWVRSVAMRIPLDKLANYQAFDLDYFDTKDFGDASTASGICPVQGASDTMYAAAQTATEELHVYTWPEAGTKVLTNDVVVKNWYWKPVASPNPFGGDWMKRTDDRITAGWLSGNTIGFAWTAARDPNFRFPHIRVAILDKDTKRLLEEPQISSRDFAYCYPSVAVNADGEVAMVFDFGGNDTNPSTAIGILRKNRGTAKSRWDLATIMAGKAFPPDQKWGDYLALRLDGKNPKNWVATSFVRENNAETEVSYHVFGLK